MKSRGKLLVEMCQKQLKDTCNSTQKSTIENVTPNSDYVMSVMPEQETVDNNSNLILCPLTGLFIQQECLSSDNPEERELNRTTSCDHQTMGLVNEDTTGENSSLFLCPSTGLFIHEESDFPMEKEKKRWRKSCPETWKRNVSKANRMASLPYETQKGLKPAKTPKYIDCSNCKFKCTEHFTEQRREEICRKFTGLEFKRQKDFILKYVQSKEPVRKNLSAKNAKSSSRSYFLPKTDTELRRVCKGFFIKTCAISHGPVDKAFENQDAVSGVYGGSDLRGKSEPGNKTSKDQIKNVEEHIQSFPVMESHYCRKSSGRKYLSPGLSISKLYSLYVEKCKRNGNLNPVSKITYTRIFGNNFNLSFFHPKKDQCLTCNNATMEDKADSQSSYSKHLLRRNEANAAKALDKIRASNDESFVSATFDLQSVLQIPSSEDTQMYYSRKLCVYNFTVYEAAPPNSAHCYVWTEVNGQRGSCEIGTALLTWVKQLDKNVTEISLYSDTCSGQNRNQYIAALFLYITQNSQIKYIQHNFMESGHSYMEVDSMHSAIESAKKYVNVYTLNDWINIFKAARSKRNKNKDSEPYTVQELRFDDMVDLKFLASKIMKNRLKNENNETVSWLKVKCLRFEYDRPGQILYKYSFNEDFKVLKVFGRGVPPTFTNLKNLYKEELSISKEKKADLLKLCDSGAIPREYHGWYKSLSINNSKDRLPEPNLDSESDEE